MSRHVRVPEYDAGDEQIILVRLQQLQSPVSHGGVPAQVVFIIVEVILGQAPGLALVLDGGLSVDRRRVTDAGASGVDALAGDEHRHDILRPEVVLKFLEYRVAFR